MRFSIIKQNRFRILICEGYRYSRYMVVYNKEYWRCTDRSCRGKLHLSSGRIVYIKNGLIKNGHNHGPDHKGISADQALFVMRKRSTSEETPLQKIYEETMTEFETCGHGPMSKMLPYSTVKWAMQNQVPGARVGSIRPLPEDNSSGNDDIEETDEQMTTDNGAEDESGGSAMATNEQKPDISDIEVIDCTAETVESLQAMPASSSVTIATHPVDKACAAPSNSGRVSYSSTPAYTDKRAPAATITGQQQASSTPGLKIHSTYSLQPAQRQANQNSSLQEHLRSTAGSQDMTTMNGIDDLCPTSQIASQAGATYTTMQSTNGALNINSTGSRARGTTPNRKQDHSMPSPFVLASRPATSSTSNQVSRGAVMNAASTVRMPGLLVSAPRPKSVQSAAEVNTSQYPGTSSSSSQGDQAYNELKMRLAKKEHRLKLQYMKERHDADMVLVHLQQEHVREQLRELRQKGGSV